MDDSILKELNRHSQRRKKRKLYLLLLAVLLIPVVLFGSYKGVSAFVSQRNKPKNVILVNKPDMTNNKEDTRSEENPTQVEASSPQPVTSSPVSSETSNDRAIVLAGLCKDVLNNAKTINAGNIEYYLSYWNMWNQSFSGRYDSPEALQQKQYYKNLYQGQYRELVNSLNKQFTQLGQCGSGNAEEILIQPNYDAW